MIVNQSNQSIKSTIEFSKFAYNFCKQFFFKLVLGINSSYNGRNLHMKTYEPNPSEGSPNGCDIFSNNTAIIINLKIELNYF